MFTCSTCSFLILEASTKQSGLLKTRGRSEAADRKMEAGTVEHAKGGCMAEQWRLLYNTKLPVIVQKLHSKLYFPHGEL